MGKVGFDWCLDRDGFALFGLSVRNSGFQVGLGWLGFEEARVRGKDCQ